MSKLAAFTLGLLILVYISCSIGMIVFCIARLAGSHHLAAAFEYGSAITALVFLLPIITIMRDEVGRDGNDDANLK